MKKSLYTKIGIEYTTKNSAGNGFLVFSDKNGIDPMFSKIKKDKYKRFENTSEENLEKQLKILTSFEGIYYGKGIKVSGTVTDKVDFYATIGDICIDIDLIKAAIDFLGARYEVYTQNSSVKAVKLVNGDKEVVIMPLIR
jgi:hypothetical protein